MLLYEPYHKGEQTTFREEYFYIKDYIIIIIIIKGRRKRRRKRRRCLLNYNSSLDLLKVWGICPEWNFSANYDLKTDKTAQMSCMAHKCGFQEVWVSSLFKHQLIFVTGQNCLTFLGVGFINSKMNRLNHKISLFSSALTFSDSNRVSLIHIMCYILKGTKSLSSSLPFSSFFSSSIPKCFPHHVIVTGNDTEKGIQQWLLTLYLKLVWTTSSMNKTQI